RLSVFVTPKPKREPMLRRVPLMVGFPTSILRSTVIRSSQRMPLQFWVSSLLKIIDRSGLKHSRLRPLSCVGGSDLFADPRADPRRGTQLHRHWISTMKAIIFLGRDPAGLPILGRFDVEDYDSALLPGSRRAL